MNMSDEQLALLSQQGDDRSFQEIVRRYLKPIYHFARQYVHTPEDAEDITQDSFYKAWKYIKKYKTEKKFKPWLYTIARNTALDYLKKKKPAVFSTLDTVEDTVPFSDTLEDAEPLQPEVFEQAELRTEMAALIDTLHPDHRSVLVLHYHEELTFEEISDILEKPMNTVKSWHRRALTKIREALHQNRP